MRKMLDDYPALAAAVRRLVSAEVTAKEAADLMVCVGSETQSIPIRRMDLWENALRAEAWAAEPGDGKQRWKFWVRPRRFISWIDLCSHDGRKREAALRVTTGGAPSAFLLALAFRRLNDWVPEVRAAARAAIPDLALNSKPEDVADVLWSLLPIWNNWGRMQAVDRDTVAAIASFDRVSRALRARVMGATVGPASFVLSQCARIGCFGHGIHEFAQDAVQPAVRARTFRWLLMGRTDWVVGYQWKWTDHAYCKGRLEAMLESQAIPVKPSFMTTLDAAMSDPSPMVRRVAAEFLIRELHTLGDHAFALAQKAASDVSPSVSERGNFALKQLGNDDSRAAKCMA